MSEIKAVKLTTGRMAVAFRIEHLLTWDDLTAALAYSVKDTPDGEELPQLSADQVHQQVREVLRSAGAELPAYWADDMWGDREGVIREWAARTVERVYGPALTPPRRPPYIAPEGAD